MYLLCVGRRHMWVQENRSTEHPSRIHWWQPYVHGNLCFGATLTKEAWQSGSRGAGVMLFWRKSQCKNAKVNKEWLLLRNKLRERACKVDSVVQEREGRWASFSSAQAQWVCKDTQWSPGATSINRQLTGFSSCFCLCSKLPVNRWIQKKWTGWKEHFCKGKNHDSVGNWKMLFYHA